MSIEVITAEVLQQITCIWDSRHQNNTIQVASQRPVYTVTFWWMQPNRYNNLYSKLTQWTVQWMRSSWEAEGCLSLVLIQIQSFRVLKSRPCPGMSVLTHLYVICHYFIQFYFTISRPCCLSEFYRTGPNEWN